MIHFGVKQRAQRLTGIGNGNLARQNQVIEEPINHRVRSKPESKTFHFESRVIIHDAKLEARYTFECTEWNIIGEVQNNEY